MVKIATFKNNQGKEIKYISIEAMRKDQKKYIIKIGPSKARAVIENLDEVKEILKELA